eukprot:COSAG01_NODE_6293_length_3751_cov_1.697700_1_plen_105_part_00
MLLQPSTCPPIPKMLSLPLLTVGALMAAASAQPKTLPAPPAGPDSNGGFFGKEVKIPPAAGKKPHIAFILMGTCRTCDDDVDHPPLMHRVWKPGDRGTRGWGLV